MQSLVRNVYGEHLPKRVRTKLISGIKQFRNQSDQIRVQAELTIHMRREVIKKIKDIETPHDK